MDASLIERLCAEMRAEFARTGPPEGFPAFHDIPAGRHTSDEFWQLEQEHLWPRTWVLAGRAEDIPNAGDFRLFDDLKASIILIRGKDLVSAPSTTRASTVARRSSAITRAPRGHLRCQYHSWTYDISSGELINVPDERDFVGLDRAERCLPAIRCEQWDNWIFVNQAPDAMPLLEWLHPIPQQLAQLQGTTLRTVARRSQVVRCNWKVTAEAFLEVYHFRHIHSRNGETAARQSGRHHGSAAQRALAHDHAVLEQRVRARWG